MEYVAYIYSLKSSAPVPKVFFFMRFVHSLSCCGHTIFFKKRTLCQGGLFSASVLPHLFHRTRMRNGHGSLRPPCRRLRSGARRCSQTCAFRRNRMPLSSQQPAAVRQEALPCCQKQAARGLPRGRVRLGSPVVVAVPVVFASHCRCTHDLCPTRAAKAGVTAAVVAGAGVAALQLNRTVNPRHTPV